MNGKTSRFYDFILSKLWQDVLFGSTQNIKNDIKILKLCLVDDVELLKQHYRFMWE